MPKAIWRLTLAWASPALVAVTALIVVVASPANAIHKPSHGGGGGGGGATLRDLDCDAGQVAMFDGAEWVCFDLFGEKIVFVSSSSSDGNLGGIAGADATCQLLADNASPDQLPGTYLAWLSTSDINPMPVSPLLRFSRRFGPYVLTNGTLVARDFVSFATGVISNPLNRDENGVEVAAAFVWTSTRADGSHGVSETCVDWTESNDPDPVLGGFGRTSTVTEAWTFSGGDDCRELNRIYCFQQ